MAPLNDIMRKVSKLLKLAEGTDHDEEAASAIAQAQRLMTQYDISEAMLEIEGSKETVEAEIEGWEDPLEEGGRLATWKKHLARILANANGCFIWTNTTIHRKKQIRLVGQAEDAAKVRYLYAYCAKELDRLARQKRGNGASWLANYRIGLATAVKDAIQREHDALLNKMRGAVPDTRALVVLDSAIAKVEQKSVDAKAWGYKKFNLVGVRSSGPRHNKSAREQGRADGGKIYPGAGAKGIGGGPRRQIGA